jgi:4'-phosphopantetheinyl transferase
MPFIKTIHINNNTQLYVWKVEESLLDLQQIYLSENSINRCKSMRSETHQKGFLSVRHLLQLAGYSDKDLTYALSGKPILNNGKHISISHSFQFAAIAISDSVIGIDIEQNRDKIKKIASKFVGNETLFLNEEKEIEHLTMLWCAKEALYKIHPDGGLSFKEHLPIDSFQPSEKKTFGWICNETISECYQINFESVENFTLAYAFPK